MALSQGAPAASQKLMHAPTAWLRRASHRNLPQHEALLFQDMELLLTKLLKPEKGCLWIMIMLRYVLWWQHRMQKHQEYREEHVRIGGKYGIYRFQIT